MLGKFKELYYDVKRFKTMMNLCSGYREHMGVIALNEMLFIWTLISQNKNVTAMPRFIEHEKSVLFSADDADYLFDGKTVWSTKYNEDYLWGSNGVYADSNCVPFETFIQGFKCKYVDGKFVDS
jgi:hypothetical protein